MCQIVNLKMNFLKLGIIFFSVPSHICICYFTTGICEKGKREHTNCTCICTYMHMYGYRVFVCGCVRMLDKYYCLLLWTQSEIQTRFVPEIFSISLAFSARFLGDLSSSSCSKSRANEHPLEIFYSFFPASDECQSRFEMKIWIE